MATKDEGKEWSGTLTLNQVVSQDCLPTLVQLEDGYRGPQETLSLSSGDIMALESCLTVRRKKVVLTYYMEDTDITEWEPGLMAKDFRKLVVLPLHNPEIARLEVRRLYDPSRDLYRRYVNSRFRGCDWRDKEEELKKLLESSSYYNEISVYTYVEEFLKKRSVPAGASRDDKPRDAETGPPLPPRRPSRLREVDSQSAPDTPPALPPRRPLGSVVDTECVYEISDDDVTDPRTGVLRTSHTCESGGVSSGAETTCHKSSGKPSAALAERRRDYVDFPVAPPPPQGALTRPPKSPARAPPPAADSDDNSDGGIYAEVDECKMVDSVMHQTPAANSTEQPRGQSGSRPIARVQPSVAPTTPSSPPQRPPVTECPPPSPRPELSSSTERGLAKITRAVDEMTVTQLCACLEKCGMKTLAEVCRRQRLDGSYLCSLPDESLSHRPFLLTTFDLDKLRRIKLGWRPNLG